MRKMRAITALAITALAISLVASLAAAQEVSAPTPLQVQVPTSGKSVSGRVSQASVSTAEPITSAASAAAHAHVTAPAAAATNSAPSLSAEPNTDAPTAPGAASTSAAVEPPQPTEWERMQEVMEPIIRNPLTGAGALLALMLLFAVLAYRRNQRNDALVLSSPQWVTETTTPEAPVDALLSTRGLQAEILALDLELGASDAPSAATANAIGEAQTPTMMAYSAADLSLSKLQLAQKLLAAGENELARVLLTSVAETLHRQLQQRGDTSQGPRQ